jgi:hypothetical protein
MSRTDWSPSCLPIDKSQKVIAKEFRTVLYANTKIFGNDFQHFTLKSKDLIPDEYLHRVGNGDELKSSLGNRGTF